MLALALSPGDVVVMDNLTAHKVAGVREALRAVGASVLYLPHSPDLNRIKQLFAKLQTLLRAPGTRSVHHRPALDAFPEAECWDYLANSGYEFT